MFPKEEKRQFLYIYENIRLRTSQGVLIFLICQSVEAEKVLIETLKGEFQEEYSFQLIPYATGDYSPLFCASLLPLDFEQTLCIFQDFPFDTPLSTLEEEIFRLLSSLNIHREWIPEKKMKCIFICSPELESLIALKAPDFHHFTQYTAFFTEETKTFPDPIWGEEEEKKTKRQQRIHFLQDQLRRVTREEVKGFVSLDLGNLYYEDINRKEALKYFLMAKDFFTQKKDYRNLAVVLTKIEAIQKEG